MKRYRCAFLVLSLLMGSSLTGQVMRGRGIWVDMPLGPHTELGEPRLTLSHTHAKITSFSIGLFRFRLSDGPYFAAYFRPRPGPPQSIRFRDPRNRYLAFLFRDGDEEAVPRDAWAREHYRLILRDADNEKTSEWPDAVDLHDYQRQRVWRYDMRREGDGLLGGFLRVTFANGRVLSLEDLGYEVLSVVRGQWTFIRQVRSPDRLTIAQRIDADRVEVLQYALDDIDGKDGDGYYTRKAGARPFIRYIFENPNPMMDDEVLYTKMEGERVVERRFYLWDEERNAFFQYRTPDTQGVPRFFEQESLLDDEATHVRETWFVEDGTEEVLNRYAEHTLWIPGLNAERVVRTETGSGDNMEIQETRYYMEDDPPGRQGKRKSRLEADGRWTAWDYDAQGRQTLQLRPPPRLNLNMDAARSEALDEIFGDLLEEAEPVLLGPPENPADSWALGVAMFYGYEPNHPEDEITPERSNPRMITNYREGRFVSRVWIAYYTDADGNPVERHVQTEHEDAEIDDPRNRQSFH